MNAVAENPESIEALESFNNQYLPSGDSLRPSCLTRKNCDSNCGLTSISFRFRIFEYGFIWLVPQIAQLDVRRRSFARADVEFESPDRAAGTAASSEENIRRVRYARSRRPPSADAQTSPQSDKRGRLGDLRTESSEVSLCFSFSPSLCLCSVSKHFKFLSKANVGAFCRGFPCVR